MTDAELLQHYIQPGAQRSPGHHRLLRLGFIEEYPVSIKNLLIAATAAGRTAIDCRPAEYAWRRKLDSISAAQHELACGSLAGRRPVL